MRSRILDSSAFHFVLAFVASAVILAVLLGSLCLVSWLVFGLLAVLLAVHPALGFAYAGLLFCIGVGFIVRDIRKGGQHGKA